MKVDEYVTKTETECKGVSIIRDLEKEINEEIVEGRKEMEQNGEKETVNGNDNHLAITELIYQEHSIESVKDNSDQFEIRGIAVTKAPGSILVCDYGNQCIKYVDNHFNVVKRYPVVYDPWDILAVDDVYVVVTFPFVRLMQYFKFKTKSRLVPWFPIKSQNEYYGVCGDRDKIIATCKYHDETMSKVPSVHVLDREGNVVRVIDKNANGENLFLDPSHIALNTSTQVIYVSDQGSKEVISLNISGRVLAHFAHTHFNPRGITVDNSNGTVFVSNKETVVHLNRNLSRIQTIGCKEDRKLNVHSLTFCSKTDRLIVNVDGSPFLRVFTI